MHRETAWQFIVDCLDKDSRVTSCIRGLNFRNGIKCVLQAIHWASLTSSSPKHFHIGTVHSRCELWPSGRIQPPVSFSLPLLLYPRWRMGFSPFRRVRRRVQNQKDILVNYRFFAHTFGDGCDCPCIPTLRPLKSRRRVLREQTGKRHLAVCVLLPGYPPDLFVACREITLSSKSLTLMFGNYVRTLGTDTATFIYIATFLLLLPFTQYKLS